ncbi:MAG TPA: hypothetical protein VJM80_11680 [bacterium]|nr:hypothetical protein [bacterium]
MRFEVTTPHGRHTPKRKSLEGSNSGILISLVGSPFMGGKIRGTGTPRNGTAPQGFWGRYLSVGPLLVSLPLRISALCYGALWAGEWIPTAPGQSMRIVRTTDGKGTLQASERADTLPNGTSGRHTIALKVK